VITINFISITEIFFLEAPPPTSTVFVGDSRELITLEVRPESLIEYDVQVTIFKDFKEENKQTYDNSSYVYPASCGDCSAYSDDDIGKYDYSHKLMMTHDTSISSPAYLSTIYVMPL
jgi:hypothetical protein